jgi:hypothetical protein
MGINGKLENVYSSRYCFLTYSWLGATFTKSSKLKLVLKKVIG